MDEILNGPAYPLELVTTKVGGMKAAFQNYCYESHYNRLGNKFWRCINHMNGCSAKIMSQGNLVYAVNVEHNHENDAFVFVSTAEIISGGQASIAMPVTGASTSDSILAVATDLTSKLKERFSSIQQKK